MQGETRGAQDATSNLTEALEEASEDESDDESHTLPPVSKTPSAPRKLSKKEMKEAAKAAVAKVP